MPLLFAIGIQGALEEVAAAFLPGRVRFAGDNSAQGCGDQVTPR